MWIALGILATVLLAGVIYLASLDGNFQVRRSRDIDAPLSSAFDAVVDLKSWPEWSPWLLHEPDAELVYSNDYQQAGGCYTWDGKVVGAGRLCHVEINPGGSIRQKIEFLRPFRSSSEVNWDFAAEGERTRVSWEMRGRMPFLFRFMSKRMEPMIARDYDLGLALLGGYLNGDSPHPRLAFIGRQSLDDFSYWSIPCRGNLRQIEASRQTSIENLIDAADDRHGLALTLYHRFDPTASTYNAEFAIPVVDSTPPSNYSRRAFAGGEYFQLSLHGAQEFIPLAWHALTSHCRMHRIRVDRSRPALEIYHEIPASGADANQAATALYIPIR